MTFFSLRRAVLVAACASAALLAACGSGTTESALSPNRFVVFGDAYADVGQSGSKYTVNDGTVTTWVDEVASRFSKTISPSSTGGFGYARVNARIVNKPDAGGNNGTLTVSEQLDTFLAANKIDSNDVLIVSGGISDLVVQTQALLAGTQTEAQLIVNVQQAGRDLGTLVRRAITAGAKQVIVVAPYNLGRSPWGIGIGKQDLLGNATTKFVEALKVSIVDLGANALYVDGEAIVNNVTATDSSALSLPNKTSAVCTSIDPGVGIGIGTGQVNSSLCTPSTVGGLAYANYAFADGLFFTPVVHRYVGDYFYERIRDRF
ncbi:MAG: family lipase [Rhodoferax sp.]|nr:family lipase [Rhodoferax sp.]